MLGQQRWIDKAAVGAVGIIAAPVLWPLMLTAGAGAIRQASLGNQVLNVVDGLVRQQRPDIQVGPVPVQIMPQIQQQWAPPPPQYIPPPQYVPPMPVYTQPPQIIDAQSAPAPTAKRLRCPSCNTPYEPGDTFCTGCGRALVTLCPNCKTEIKDNVSFCPKCGASIFQAGAPTEVAQPVQPPPQPLQPLPHRCSQLTLHRSRRCKCSTHRRRHRCRCIPPHLSQSHTYLLYPKSRLCSQKRPSPILRLLPNRPRRRHPSSHHNRRSITRRHRICRLRRPNRGHLR